ncbi:hypothetical protein DDB_G0282521 [Dictyostelium discoideum AX4]|uniref:Uncharacterized protein n=1 Tax=Dictyostelium discoideum TaxID=44689 RepID=Q54SD9_DICDI|nr:hypothetical protein DDB_G0282521 [Dictyostelium discoideum AX4]EAL66120.1 hypothetical protein DDB_G0282521 [Dictyostelium discoideum AX4]|eukprot:XP_640100.1 hypothetical protein DDB_G0282521 [Dictyostelium discoideum AX4]
MDFASNLLLELNSYSFKIKNGRFRYRFRNRTKINNLTKEIQDEKNEDTKKKVEEEKKILIKIKASIKERDDEIKSKDDQYYFKTKGVPNIKFSGSDKKISIQHLECSFEEREFKELDNPYCVDQGRSSLLWKLSSSGKDGFCDRLWDSCRQFSKSGYIRSDLSLRHVGKYKYNDEDKFIFFDLGSVEIIKEDSANKMFNNVINSIKEEKEIEKEKERKRKKNQFLINQVKKVEEDKKK